MFNPFILGKQETDGFSIQLNIVFKKTDLGVLTCDECG